MVVNSYQVLETYTYKTQKRYRVKCLVCGKTFVKSSAQLHKPCACTQCDDVVGKVYGDLFVYDKYVLNQQTYYKCVCQLCGNLTDVLGTNLKRGHTTSCGCKKTINLEGKTFGNITVGKRTKKCGKTYYYCLCRLCGKTVLKRADIIPTITSCGCDKEENRIAAIKEKVFMDGTQPSKIRLDKAPTKANKSGVVGVCWDKSRGKWKADIRFKNKKYNLGRFENFEDAVEARKEAEKNLFGGFLEWYENFKDNKEEKS